MAKNSVEQIILDEKKIIEELQKNANKSINEIAQKCGFSRQKVWRIIKNLEENNTIWGYSAIIDEEKQNKKSYTALIKRTNLPLTKELIKNLIGTKIGEQADEIGVDIISSTYVNGFYDWLLCFTADDIRQAKRFIEILNITFQGYISNIILLEKMFWVKKCGIDNPDSQELEKFFYK